VDVSKLPAPATRTVDFGKDIQPIFEKSCLKCHNPEQAKGKLLLDTREHALKGGEDGVVIFSGESAKSPLIHFTARVVEDSEMPPIGKGEPLSKDQVGLLRAWIDQGVKWPDGLTLANPDGKGGKTEGTAKTAIKKDHWAFRAPVRPALPAIKDKRWARDPIDDFVLARLEKEKLKPSPEADRPTLIRRLSLDLIGLPPTIKEADDFVADRRPDAYERVVERLLASAHYGERWGRHWLDAARYADTNGYEKDKPRSIWPYRDWVINAFNTDMPFDEFTIEQLAGDLLPKATMNQKIATGFLRNSMLNQEGGIEPEQFRVEAMIDRMDTLGKAFLGLTINCCQCHDHKYDPFPQKEYYQLYAFLNNDDESFMEVPTAEEQKKRDEVLAKVRKLEDQARSRENTNASSPLAERMATWEKHVANVTTNWTILDSKDWSNFATKFEKQDDLSLLGGGDLQPGGVMRVWVETKLTNITGFRLEALTNPNLIYGGPGLLGKGSFLVKKFEVEAWGTNFSGGTASIVTNKVKFKRALADMEAPGFSVTNAIDGNSDKGGWTAAITPDQRNRNHRAVFECAEPIGFPGGTYLLFTIHEKFDSETKLDCHMLGSFRLSATTDSGPLSVDPLSADQRKIVLIPTEKRSDEQQRALFDAYRLSDPAFSPLNQKIANAWTNWPYPATTLVLKQRPQPRVTHIFKRGDRMRPGDDVKPEVPSILHPFPEGAPRNRLGLAKWIVDPHNPTTARVIVNRIWQEYFGQGLVTTPEDFGTRVETPSHPELLDWLACEFISPESRAGVRPSSGAAASNEALDSRLQTQDSLRAWSIKHIHRLIVNSATYRQSSRVTPELYANDQYNRLLARGSRVRVEGEVVQDIALSVSGLLNPKIGGPSIYPTIPGNVGDTAYGGFSWPETKGAAAHRRGLYTYWKRSLPFPTLMAFDAPTADSSCTRRVRSNTPLQALTTLNEKSFVEAAQAMALRIMNEGGADERSRVTYAFQLCTGRKPEPDEVNKLLQFWKEQYDYFEDRTAAAATVALGDPTKIPPDVNLHKVAAWAMVSRAVLNLDETITKE
jgi:hypothetical protein